MTTRLVVLLSCLLLMAPIIVQAPSGEESYADIKIWMNFENCGGSPCTGNYSIGSSECSDAGTTWTVSGSGQVSTTASMGTGTYGAEMDVTATDYYQEYNASVDNMWDRTSGRVGSHVRFDSTVPDPSNFWYFSIRAGADDRLWGRTLDVSGTQEWEAWWVYNNSTQATCTTSGFGVAADTTYYFEIAYDAGIGDGSDELIIYVDGVAEATCNTETMTPMDSDAGYIEIGRDSWIDNFRVSTDPDRDLYATASTESDPATACDGGSP